MQRFHQEIKPDYEFFWHLRDNPKKQATLCVMFYGATSSVALATCSENDQYNRKVGRLIARGRAKKQLVGEPRDGKVDRQEAYNWAANVAKGIREDRLQ